MGQYRAACLLLFFAQFGMASSPDCVMDVEQILGSSERDYFAVPARVKERVLAHTNPSLETDLQTKISQNGMPKKIGNSYSLQLNGSQDFAEVYTYGSPYTESGVTWIDFALWHRPNSKEADVEDAAEPVLRRMALGDFFEATRSTYPSRLKLDKAVLLPSTKKGTRGSAIFELYQVLEVTPDKARVMNKLSGEKRWVSLEEIFRTNVSASSDELRSYRRFFDEGGTGRILRNSYDTSNPQYTGDYLQIMRLPDKDKAKHFVFAQDDEARKAIQKLLDDGHPVLLSGDGHDFRAFHAPPTNPMNQYFARRSVDFSGSSSTFAFTDRAGREDVAHEIEHMAHNALFKEKFYPRLNALGNSAKLSTPEAIAIFRFLDEQRAYSAGLATLADAAKKGLKVPAKGSLSISEVDARVLLEKQAKLARDIFAQRYAPAVRAVLDRLQKKNPEAYAKLRSLLLEWRAESSEMDLSRLLPEHFADASPSTTPPPASVH